MNYTLIDIARLIRSKFKSLMLWVALVGLVVAVLSMFMPNYYKATTLFYPAAQDLSKASIVFSGVKDLDYFGNREDLDRMLTIAEGGPLVSALIEKYDLYSRYDVNREQAKSALKVRLKLERLFEVKRTERDAISLSIEDIDPVFSADITNYARQYIDTVARQNIRSSQQAMLKMMHDNVDQKEQLLKSFSDSLRRIQSKYNIYNASAQSEYLSQAVAEAEANLAEYSARLNYLRSQSYVVQDTIRKIQSKVNGYNEKLKSLTSTKGGLFNLESYREGIRQFEQIKDRYYKELEQLNYAKINYNQLKLASESNTPALHVIEEATVPYVKSRPRRSLLVLGSCFLAFAIGVLALLSKEFWRQMV